MTMLQLFDPASSTYTYAVWDPVTRDAVLIDGVLEQVERDLAHLERLGLKLAYTLDTHVHADHVTSAGVLRQRTGARVALPAGHGCIGVDVDLGHGAQLRFGGETVAARLTPGHTASSASYLWRDAVFTGDALLIGGCGRTDFQEGDAGQLYDSVTRELFTLPPATRVYPAHDYNGNLVSTIGYEMTHNPRLADRSREAFIGIMGALHLEPPKLIDIAVPANRRLGL